jgi:hypothetical protein
MPKPQQTDQPCAGFVFCVDCMRKCDTFRLRLTNEVWEMNKQELIDKAVHELKGVLRNHKDYFFNLGIMQLYFPEGSFSTMPVCTTEEFQQRARELGYINGYRWGVEYPTNGEKPDLPDDVDIQYWTSEFGRHAANVISLNWSHDYDKCYPAIKFKITDERYKPADTSYLYSVSEIPESKSNAENISDWWDYEAQKAVTLPPVGVECQYLSGNGKWDSCSLVFVTDYVVVIEGLASGTEKVQIAYNFGYWPDFRPLDYNRKAEAEKKRVVDAAFASLSEFNKAHQVLGELYDAGFLRMPAE